MPTYDVTFTVEYKRTVRVDADDEDCACEKADEMVRLPLAAELGRAPRSLDVELYSCEVARKDDDA